MEKNKLFFNIFGKYHVVMFCMERLRNYDRFLKINMNIVKRKYIVTYR